MTRTWEKRNHLGAKPLVSSYDNNYFATFRFEGLHKIHQLAMAKLYRNLDWPPVREKKATFAHASLTSDPVNLMRSAL